RLRQRIAAVGLVAAEAHVDDAGPRRRPLHAGDDPRVGAPFGYAHLAVDQRGVGRDAAVLALRRRAGAADDAGDVGAVADVVAGVGAGAGEVDRLGDLAGEVGVIERDAGVEHGDGDAVPGETERPCGRRADLRHALVEQEVLLAVEPDRRDAGGQRDR